MKLNGKSRMSLKNIVSSGKRILGTSLLVGVLAASLLVTGCDKKTDEAQENTGNDIGAAVEKTIGQNRMKGIRKAVFDAFLKGESTVEYFPDPINYIYCHSNSGVTLGYGTLASMDFNLEGINAMADMMKDSYVIVSPIGDLSIMEPGKLKDNFQLVRSLFLRGGTIQMIGFDEDSVVGKRNPKIFHPGNDLSGSFIEERLGKSDSRIEDFGEWQESYLDKNISRLFSVSRI